MKERKKELKNFFNEINKKHPSIKFDQKYSKLKIEFLDVLVHKDEQQRLEKTLFKKKADKQFYLYEKTDQRHSQKVFCTVKYHVFKAFLQQTASSRATVNRL